MVYFIEDIENKRIKIGKSKNPAHRLSQLQVSNSNKLKIIGVIEDNIHLIEQDFHILFSDYRIRGEWFYGSDVLIKFIKSFSKPYKPKQNNLQKDFSKWFEYWKLNKFDNPISKNDIYNNYVYFIQKISNDRKYYGEQHFGQNFLAFFMASPIFRYPAVMSF